MSQKSIAGLSGIDSRFDDRAAQVNSRLAGIDSRFDDRAAQVDGRLAGIDSRFDDRAAQVDSRYEERVAQVDERYGERVAMVDNKLDQMNSRYEDRVAHVDSRYEDRVAHVDSRYEDRVAHVDSRYEDRVAHVDSRHGDRVTHVDIRFAERADFVDKRFEDRAAQVDERFEQRAAHVDNRYGQRVAFVDMQIEDRAVKVERDIKNQLCKVDLVIEMYDVDNQSFISEIEEVTGAQAEMNEGFLTFSIVKNWSEFEEQMIPQRIREIANDFNLSVAWNEEDSPSLCSINSDGTFTYVSLTASVVATETSEVNIMLEGKVLEGSMVYLGIDENFLLPLVESNVVSVDVSPDGTWTTHIQGEIDPSQAEFPAKIYTMVTRNRVIKGHEFKVVQYSEFDIIGLSGQYEVDKLIELEDSTAQPACPPSLIPDGLRDAFRSELGDCMM